MRKKKKILLVLAVILGILIIPIAFLVGQLYSAFAPIFTTAPNHIVEDYVEEKYGFEVDIIEKNTYGLFSPTEFTVSVDSDDYGLIEDDYDLALNTDKEYEKLKTVLPEIEEPGFSGTEEEPIRLDYFEDSAFLQLESDKPVDYETFVAEDFNTYYELYKLV